MRIRSYSGLRDLDTIEARYEYLKLGGEVGETTFGYDRYLNQNFYTSTEWRQIRHHVIARDLGCDLGVEGFEIRDRIYIHHMNPMTPDDLKHGNEDNLNPDVLISCSLKTHNAIHYGDANLLPVVYQPRRPGDTKLW